MTSSKKYTQGGYALMTALMFFLAGGIAVVAGLSDSVLREVRTVRNESTSKQSYYASESSLEDAIYRIKTGKQIGSTETLMVASSSATTTITTAGDGSQTINSAGDALGTKRTLEATMDTTSGVSFPFLLQGGLGGIEIDDGSIIGDVYTTGSIKGCGSCSISGAAVSAATATISVDQANSTPLPPTQSITFANAASTQDLAQGFRVSDELSLVKIEVYIKKVGNPSNATIKIMTGSGSAPSYSGVIASGTISSSLVGTGYSWIEIPLTANQILDDNTTYWIVIDANPDASNYYVIAANSTYGNGQAKIGRTDWGSWSNTSPSGLDAYFKLTLGTSDVGIMGKDQYNDLSVGSAYAYNVNYVSSTGSLYCQAGSGNNKACDTSRANPVVEPMPVSGGTITLWKNEAVAGGTVSSQSVNYSGATLGPKKISGTLTVSGGGTLRVSGTLWVTGDVTISGGAHVRSNNSSKSFAIVSDGKITLSGGASIDGATNSHILLVSTSNDPAEAIKISGGANDTALYASNGGVTITGGASVKAGAAQYLYISGGANVVYDPQMSSLNLTSDESGAATSSSNIKSWKESQ
ncbi:MAG: hypothetical protein RLZZ67_236 [Candidatus Parcubacteria bacterium]|jgi:hypothetical protein